ncbi:MAG: hypothetical protein C0603_09300 [Denitrovibrio sp.]|nr:MAG: hypothetical protein C0603_09300 [Denitrovibrio sp.]
MKFPLSIPSPTEAQLEQKYVSEALSDNQAATGKYITLFEESVADLVKSKNAMAVVNGTSAIHLALLSLGIGKGDLVFASTFTFIGSVSPIVYVGAEPVFIDSDKSTWNIDPNLLEDELKRRTSLGEIIPKALLITHLYGQPADMDSIVSICDKYGVIIIEDAAESLGAAYGDKQTGTFGKCGIFSFNANKIITSGGGGILVSDDADLVAKARYFANQAKEPVEHYEHLNIGYNYRISNLQSACGYAQMQELQKRIHTKRTIFDKYRKALEGAPVTFMPEHEKAVGSRWLTTLLFNDEDKESIYGYLKVEGIESR